ncbi:hypothetical protein RF11_10644 [Thelohanellus kitauei]|uniref:Uncharacterized protein n=1 Tax=Thelohanellus kitauei TaxID=669202 RepID=A0A0C2IUM1_THEKT|nr:hypothetical protein RF11_10644 [Thelohanellus kitauei]
MSNPSGNNVHTFAESLVGRILKIEEKEKIIEEQDKYKRLYDINVHDNKLRPGSWARICIANLLSLRVRYGKPLKVVEEQSPGTYLLEVVHGKQLVIHHDLLKRIIIDEKYAIPLPEKRLIRIPRQNRDYIESQLPGFGGERIVT